VVRNRSVKVGIVGCGYWGSKHLRVFNELPNAEVVALCDASEANIAKQPKGFLPPLVTGDYEEFLNSNIDAVVIATPARTHYPLALKALQRGKHVLTEKPFATSSSQAEELIRAAEKGGLTLMVGHTYVYHPAVEFLREMVQTEQLGPLYYIHTARLNFGLLQPDVDVLWDLAPHDLSILLYTMGEEPIAGGARGTAHVNPSLYEIAHVDLEFLNGLLAHIYVSWLEPIKVRRFVFVGGDRTVVYDDVADGEMIRVYNKGIKLDAGAAAGGNFAPQYLQEDINIPFLPSREPLRAEASHFLDCIRTGKRPLSDGWEGLKVVRILEAVEKSLYNGGSMELFSPELRIGHDEEVPVPTIQRRGRL
jgi:predicted dehydrogenase